MAAYIKQDAGMPTACILKTVRSLEGIEINSRYALARFGSVSEFAIELYNTYKGDGPKLIIKEEAMS